MTDIVTGSNDSPNTSIPDTTAGQTMAPAMATPAAEERLLKQSEVNEIVGRAKHEAVERYKRANEAAPVVQQQSSGISQDEIRRLAAEEAHRLRDEWISTANEASMQEEGKRLANEFLTKMSSGKDTYEDFDTVTGSLDYIKIPDMVQLANAVDNTADVMYDLAKNPAKIAVLRQLVGIDQKLAQTEMQRLSKSIKDNGVASRTRLPNEPLSTMRPSNTGVESGRMEVRDYRLKYRA